MQRLTKNQREKIEDVLNGDSCVRDGCVPKGLIERVIKLAEERGWDKTVCLKAARKRYVALWDNLAAPHFK